MEVLSAPRFLLSGVASGVGKSILAVGLSVALRKRNVSLSCCIVGSDLVEALILRRLTRRYVRSLDVGLLSTNQVLAGVHHASIGADLVLIEGKSGLFDGFSPGNLRGSDAEIAALTRTNVILVVDARGLGSSLAALVSGFSGFSQGFSIMGTLANRAKDNRGEPRDKVFYDTAVQGFGMGPLVGVMPELDLNMPTASGAFTQRSNRASLPLQFFVELGNLVNQHVDIDEILNRAKQSLHVKLADIEHRPLGRRCRVAVSEDNCFSLCYQDNLDLLRYFGAEIVPFSPLADSSLPKKIGALYLTGASLSEYGQELSNNRTMHKAIRDFSQNGGVVFTEGAGTAYLCESFQNAEGDEFVEGVGLLPARARFDDRPLVYCEAVTVEDSVLGRAGLIVKGIQTGEWRIEETKRVVRTLRVSHGGGSPIEEGYSPSAQTVSTLLFTHFGSNPAIAKNIVDAAEIVNKI